MNEKIIIPSELFIYDKLEGSYYGIDKDNEMIDCFLNLPALIFDVNQISMQEINNQQQQSISSLIELTKNNPIQFPTRKLINIPIIAILGIIQFQNSVHYRRSIFQNLLFIDYHLGTVDTTDCTR